MGEFGRRGERFIGDIDFVMGLVAASQTLQHLYRLFYIRLLNENGREAPLQGGVLFNVFAEFVQCGCADALQLAARKSRFEHVAGVHGALGRPRADDSMQFVDEEDDVALTALNLLNGGFQPLLELAAEARARDHGAQIKRHHRLAAQNLGHIVVGDFLRQAL